MTEVKDTAAHFVAAFNSHDERALLALHADNIKFEAPGGFKAHTAKDATEYAMNWLKAYPNGKMTVRNEVVSAPWIVQEIILEGTNTGPLEGPTGTIQPTHKKIVAKAIHVFKIENGKLSEARVYFDMFETMSQLGLIPTPATV